MNSKRLLSFLVICFSILLWYFVSDRNEQLDIEKVPRPNQFEANKGADRVEDQSTHRENLNGGFRFLDKLTGKEIPGSLVFWRDGRSSTHLVNVGVVEESFLNEKRGICVIPEYFGRSFEFTLSELEKEGKSFFLPIMGGVSVEVFDEFNGYHLDEVACEVSVLEREKYTFATGGGGTGLEVAFSPLGSVTQYIRVYEKENGSLKWSSCLPDAKEETGFFSGHYLDSELLAVRVRHKNYGQSVAIIDINGGEQSQSQFALYKRPRITGRLTNKVGDPLANVAIDIIVDQGDYSDDISETDNRFALIVGGEPGNWHRAARITIQTSSDGDFDIFMPKGIQYAVEYAGKMSYGFSESIVFGTPPREDVKLDVVSVGYSEGYEVHVLFENGKPAEGMFLRPRIANDWPWFRQFPSVLVDEKGTVRLPMVEQGQIDVRLILQSQWDWTDGRKLGQSPLLRLPKPPYLLVIPTPDEG